MFAAFLVSAFALFNFKTIFSAIFALLLSVALPILFNMIRSPFAAIRSCFIWILPIISFLSLKNFFTVFPVIIAVVLTRFCCIFPIALFPPLFFFPAVSFFIAPTIFTPSRLK